MRQVPIVQLLAHPKNQDAADSHPDRYQVEVVYVGDRFNPVPQSEHRDSGYDVEPYHLTSTSHAVAGERIVITSVQLNGIKKPKHISLRLSNIIRSQHETARLSRLREGRSCKIRGKIKSSSHHGP